MIQWGLWRQMTKDEECFQPTWLCPPLLDQSFWGLGFVSTGFMMMVRDASVSSKFGYGGVPYDDGDDIHDLMIWQKYCPVGKRHWLLRSWEFRSADRCTLRWWRWWQWRRLLWRWIWEWWGCFQASRWADSARPQFTPIAVAAQWLWRLLILSGRFLPPPLPPPPPSPGCLSSASSSRSTSKSSSSSPVCTTSWCSPGCCSSEQTSVAQLMECAGQSRWKRVVKILQKYCKILQKYCKNIEKYQPEEEDYKISWSIFCNILHQENTLMEKLASSCLQQQYFPFQANFWACV